MFSIMIICAVVVLPVVVGAAFIHWFYSRESNSNHKCIRKFSRVLLVIAHPDDECLFFGPTILALTKSTHCDFHLLCLSSGNHYKQGPQRKLELKNSCRILGIQDHNVTIIDHTKLPDEPTLLWNRNIVEDIILRYIEQLGIDTLLTFDDYGVSGHLNHRAIFRAIQHLYNKGKLPVNTQVFILESVSLFRKYLGTFDVLLSFCSSSFCYVSGLGDYRVIVMAMRQHRSQLKWFRILYVIFSRYMCVNTFKRIAMSRNFYNYNNVNRSTHRSVTPS